MTFEAFARLVIRSSLASYLLWLRHGHASGIELDVNVLDLCRIHQFFDQLFAAQPGMLLPAERRAQVMRSCHIRPYIAGLDARGGTMSGGKIAGPDRSRE